MGDANLDLRIANSAYWALYGVSWSFCHIMTYVGIIKSLICEVCELVALEWCLATKSHRSAPEFVFTFTNIIGSQSRPRSHSFPFTNVILYPTDRHPVSKVNDRPRFIDREGGLYLDLVVSAKFSWSGITLLM